MDNYKTLKRACYSTNITMSVVGNISPVLFLTFRNLYGISYSLLGLLVGTVIFSASSGFCVSMLWPGNLIIASDRVKNSGVFIYAIMAAGEI